MATNVIQTLEKFKRPEIFLAELVRKYVRGEFLEKGINVPLIQRAIVLAVDTQGALLENPDAQGSLSGFSATHGPSNPKNSIKARIITAGHDQFRSDSEARVFWPLLPEHMVPPIKPGEHAYVMFEDPARNHGLWLFRVSGHDDPNVFLGASSFVSKQKDSLPSKFGLEDPDVEAPPIDDFSAGLSPAKENGISSLFFRED